MTTLPALASEFAQVLGGVFRLDGGAFVDALSGRGAVAIALGVVLVAGLSEAVGQSIVLFANRVSPARFLVSLLVDAVLFTFGYAFLVLSTYVVCLIPGMPHVAFATLALALGVSYAPLLFAFLGALPYLGSGVQNVLRIWHLLALVVGFSAVARTNAFAAAACVSFGWVVMMLAQRSFGRPLTSLGARLLDTVAGVRVVDDAELQIGDVAESAMDIGHPPRRLAVTPKAAQHPSRWTALVGLGGVALLFVFFMLALEPVRRAAFGWEEHLPRVAQVPLNLIWLVVVAVLVSAFMAPLETLGWYAGWFGDRIDTSDETDPHVKHSAKGIGRFVVYLDGIAQSSNKYTPDIETFLDALAPELPKDVRLVRGVMGYSVMNKPLEEDPVFSRFWKFVDASRARNLNSLLGMIINLRNVLVVAVSADPRYGPMYNFGIARVIYRSLIANGYPKNSGVPVTLIGYSGGGQMSCGAARPLKLAIDAPIDVISLGGVISGQDPILDLEQLHHLVGDKDQIERLGPLMFASRWKIAVLSYWNRAKRLGTLTEISLGPVGHQVPGGMLDPNATLPDGRTNLRQTLDYIESIMLDRLETPPVTARKATNYERYAAGGPPAPGSAPDPARYRPCAQWIGRLILPAREARFGGAFFDVRHAPAEHADLAGKTVRLCWSGDASLRERLRAVRRDVSFSAEASYAARFGGLVMPVRVNHWRLVDPLESLAGSHPVDDVIVKLDGNVAVEGDGGTVTLRIDCEPVQITGDYYGLVQFLGAADADAGTYRVLHYDANAATFAGGEELVRLPPVVPDLAGNPNSSVEGIERSPLNVRGWYVYGSCDASGTFVVRALAPRELFDLDADVPLTDERAAWHFVRREAWREIAAKKGSAVRAGSTPWKRGDRALLLHAYGGIGGAKRESTVVGPFYFGHFAFGIAEVVDEPLTGTPRFDITYYQIYTQNPDGLTAGKLHWSRYLGDRQYGWAGIRPVCDALFSLDDFSQPFDIGRDRRAAAIDGFAWQLEAMAARYRIGDGTGGTFVSPANNCAQDSSRALFATVRAIETYVREHPAYADWIRREPEQAARLERLSHLARALQKKLQPFGAPRADWSANEYNLGSTLADAPIANLVSAVGSWRCALPRLAFETIAATLLQNGATVTVLGSSQIGGDRPEIEPVVPMTL